jgi:hypothetical protein
MRTTFRCHLILCAILAACSSTGPDQEVSSKIEQQLQDPSAILGFESTTLWTTTAGAVTSELSHTQGAKSLGITNFTYAELTSAALATPPNVSNQIKVDVRLNAAATTDQIQLYVNIPSLQRNKMFVQSKQLTGVPANTWTTITFDVPASLVNDLRSSYQDLTFTVALISPSRQRKYALDNLRFAEPAPVSKVELSVSGSNAFVYAIVDGIVRRVFVPNDPALGERIDVSSWLGAGPNRLRLQALRMRGSGDTLTSFHVQAWADGAAILDSSCTAADCGNPDAPARIWLDEERTLTLAGPAKTRLTVSSSVGGSLYIAAPGVRAPLYTGLTVSPSAPTTLELAPGSYQVGLGTGNDTPGSYTGAFYQRSVSLGSAPVSVDLGEGTPEPVQSRTRIAVVPIRHNYVPDASVDGELTDNDVQSFKQQLELAQASWYKPFSYGLSEWQFDVLPTVEDTPLVTLPEHPNADGSTAPADPKLDDFMRAEGLDTPLQGIYPITVYFMSNHRSDGSVIDNALGSVFALQGTADCRVVFTTEYSRGFDRPASQLSPNYFALHELLHCFEARNDRYFGFYDGLNGLHGAGVHGYPRNYGDIDFLTFYRRYMRGQVAETLDMRAGVEYPSLFPATANAWIGIFPAVRGGYNP